MVDQRRFPDASPGNDYNTMTPEDSQTEAEKVVVACWFTDYLPVVLYIQAPRKQCLLLNPVSSA
jgi:hypothetical protein